MDISRVRELEYRISHRHKDGGWGEMVEVPQHHTAVEHDPERRWGDSDSRLYKCTSCEEWAVIRRADERGRAVDEDDE